MAGGVRKRGEKWYYYYEAGSVAGKRKRIERVGGKTKKEAQDKLRKALNEYENAGIHVDETGISFADYFNYWYKNYVMLNLKYKTQKGYIHIIEKHLIPEFGKYRLKSIKTSHLQTYLNSLVNILYSKNTKQGIYGVLSRGFKMAVYPFEYLKDSPMIYAELPKMPNNDLTKKKAKLKIISEKDYERIIERIPVSTPTHIPIQIAYHTGMRAGEVCGLTWDNVDLENKIIHVDKQLVLIDDIKPTIGTPKTFSSIRDIEIGDTLVNILIKHKLRQESNKEFYGKYYYQEDYDFVCRRENGQVVTQNAFKHLSDIVNKELGIDFSFHSFRHTHATMLLEKGADAKDVQARLGHGDINTTMNTYAHATKKMSRKTVDLFEKDLPSNNWNGGKKNRRWQEDSRTAITHLPTP